MYPQQSQNIESDNMKNITELTIAEFMTLELIINTFKEDENKIYSEITKFIYGSLDVPKRDADATILSIYRLMEEKPDFVHRFKFNDIEYGFIPNLDEITTAEFIDLDEYMKEGKQLHKIAAFLYRPVIKSASDTYQIEKYEGTQKYAEVMRGVNYKIILGALVFFWNLRNSLLAVSDTFIKKSLKKNNQKMKKNS